MSAAAVPVPPPRVSREELLARARESSRQIERFTYRLVSEAEGKEAVEEARRLMALAVGLRRKLDAFGGDHGK